MEYIHIRSLEKYHPKYRDRELKWAKIYFSMVQGDPDCELIENEIDWARLVKMILLELEAKFPLPNDDRYWAKKGFDVKNRPMSLTIQMLHNFLDVVTEEEKLCTLYKEELYKEEKEIDKISPSQVSDLLTKFSNTLQEKIKVYIDRARQKNKSKVITEGRKLTLLTELYNTKGRCADDNLFGYALDMAINYDAPCIGYVNAVIKNKKMCKK